MFIIKAFDISLLEDSPPELASQLIFLYEENTAFKNALIEQDINNLNYLLNKGVPYSSNILDPDVLKYLPCDAIQSFDQEYQEIFNLIIPHYIIKNRQHHVIELLASFFMLRKSQEFNNFRGQYFSVTQVPDVAINYLQQLLDLEPFKREKLLWSTMALYNESTDFFKQLITIYKQYDTITDCPLKPLLSSIKNDYLDIKINTHSFEHYFDLYFFDILTYQIEVSEYRLLTDYSHDEAINNIFYQIFSSKSSIEEQETVTTLSNFLFKRYKELYPDMDNADFLKLFLYNFNINNISRTMEIREKRNKENNKKISVDSERIFNSLKNTKIKQATDNMLKVLKELVLKHSPEDCQNIFKAYHIDASHYKEVNNFANINKKLSQKSKIEKVKKI